MVRYLFTFLIGLLSGITLVSGQLSDGGTPRKLNALKKAAPSIISMPAVSNEVLRWEAERRDMDSQLKPLTFAHAFEVDLDPQRHGTWNQSDDGWWIWQMNIKSKTAFSLNLIFEDFYPGINDRLFLFDPEQSYIIGSFGSKNITESGVFPVSPVPGEELVVQFETPYQPGKYIPFKITRINHDFLGIVSVKDIRRPLGLAGDCISDVNCELADPWRELQNSVCRIMIEGREFCTGTLINNTAENKRPFIITANHCISTRTKATSSLFLFNYESPYCGPLDGDVSNSLAGSTLRATHDSLDFTLVELSVNPPPHFRPHFSGWNRSTAIQDTIGAIHHSQGDIKKITVDVDVPVIASFGTAPSYTPNGFWRVNRWEFGALEVGASGGPLFNKTNQLFGTLVGGTSRCGYPLYDYFTRFDMAWDRNPDSTKQLRYWLDPVKINPLSMDSRSFNTGPDFCKTFTNMEEGDKHEIVRITKSDGQKGGFWLGTNTEGITEVADKFKIPGDEKLHGVSVGIGRRFLKTTLSNSRLKINVYNLKGEVVEVIHSQQVLLRDLVADAMNYIAFNDNVQPADSFLVAFSFDSILEGDSIAIYHSFRQNPGKNTIYIKRNEAWTEFNSSLSGNDKAGALALEVVACNVSSLTTDTTKIDNPLDVKIYPNPSFGRIEIASSMFLTEDMISIYSMHGQQIPYTIQRLTPRKFEINISGVAPGIYLIMIWDGLNHYGGKVILTGN
jgi:lysyl endopeptidase